VGPKTDQINPVISITIEFLGGKDLQEKVDEIRKNLQPSIDTGQLEIESEEKTSIKQL
ncbi:MAG: peptidylprolyl isomerase, partial [Nitrosopumilaceae archaeon]|nr:peptidylprolyl isomerase [Nitrosopumilaceae archaeon]NIU88646.1 peptidylprolyl isomerase [Nitrosopumilaceae archaeon]NIV66793.1 peptidylprolyl isomerase [Nitrosopumilaceae archaeon]NIX62775.1 peptidylprolyl isomerase [Nitrosopumilaceae archaeon]